ncbi:MAG: PD40 domain-containing protein [Bacteroidia bacterium]|nr:PD40 domain-containing protein [Bacteroidia bacterium]
MQHKQIFAFLFFNSLFLISFSQLPNTDIWLLDIKDDKGKITFSNPINITNRDGYDNQPAFSPDGKYILFTSIREGVQADIYKYDIAGKQTSQFTKTEESEYSPTFMPDGKFISTVRVEKDSAQRLWKFPVNSGEPTLVTANVKNVGYHCWINKDSVALFILPEPFTLQIANITTEKTTIIDDSIGRCTQKTQKHNAITYTTKDTSKQAFIHLYKLDKRPSKTIFDLAMKKFKAYKTAEDYVWYSNNTLIMGSGSELAKACVDCYDPNWKIIQDLKVFGIDKIGRIAISADRKKIALVTTN